MAATLTTGKRKVIITRESAQEEYDRKYGRKLSAYEQEQMEKYIDKQRLLQKLGMRNGPKNIKMMNHLILKRYAGMTKKRLIKKRL